MKMKDAYDLIIREYLGTLRPLGCDGCVAEFYCIKNMYKKSREPQNDCPDRIKEYLRYRRC